jgi:ribonucleoside-diphosphate reductase alpha chain
VNRGERERLPNRRSREHVAIVSARVAGLMVHLHTATYDDGRLAEVFIDIAHADPTIQGWAANLARNASVGLQYGVPLDELIDAWTFQKFEPHGVVVGHDAIHFCSSLLDYVGRELGITYGGRADLGHQEVA